MRCNSTAACMTATVVVARRYGIALAGTWVWWVVSERLCPRSHPVVLPTFIVARKRSLLAVEEVGAVGCTAASLLHNGTYHRPCSWMSSHFLAILITSLVRTYPRLSHDEN